MANFGIKQFNYQNVVNSKQSLITNRDTMEELFGRYKNELTNLETNWLGQSGNVSREDMNNLIVKYNEFVGKVNSFITLLGNAEVGFSDQEKESISTYNR